MSTSQVNTNGACTTETRSDTGIETFSNKVKTPASREHVVIRSTQAVDIPQIADLLATASMSGSSSASLSPWNSWKAKVDHLWAKSDIEGLITTRYEVLQEGRKAYRRVNGLLLESSLVEQKKKHEHETAMIDEGIAESDRLRLLWTLNSSEKFRRALEKASKSTGEDNVWRLHNLSVPPPSASWLRHLQLTAVATKAATTAAVVPSTTRGNGAASSSSSSGNAANDKHQAVVVVGFCEVAVLWNPCRNTYSPAILNLATAPNWRQRGVATRLLKTACRYVSTYWNHENNCNEGGEVQEVGTNSLGLFVEKDNHAAMSLYKKLGFESKVSCDGGDKLGEMWYMTKELDGWADSDATSSSITSTATQHEESLAR